MDTHRTLDIRAMTTTEHVTTTSEDDIEESKLSPYDEALKSRNNIGQRQ